MTSLVWSVDRLLIEGASAGPVLGIATGSVEAGLGLVTEGRVYDTVTQVAQSHCAGVPGAVEKIVTSAHLCLRDLAGIAVALGPGSFTGLRVGLSYAKGLARAAGIPLVGIPTLDAIALLAAHHGGSHGHVCALLDARRGEVYAALYQFSGLALERETDDLALTAAELVELLERDTIIVGDAKASEVQDLAAARGLSTTLSSPTQLNRTGSMVAAIAAARIVHNQIDAGAVLEPRYVRASGAPLLASKTVK
jgi:tRNA threonylcarbamoyladenosine biosynthesis protein TsaB